MNDAGEPVHFKGSEPVEPGKPVEPRKLVDSSKPADAVTEQPAGTDAACMDAAQTLSAAASPTRAAKKKKKKKKSRPSYKQFMCDALKPSKRKRVAEPLVHARFPKLKDRL